MTTAVVLPVPLGPAAHVPLLVPFVPADEGIEEELRFFFSHIDALDLELTRTAGEVGLVGTDVAALADALALRWPGTTVPDRVAVVGAPAERLPRRVHVDHAALWRDGEEVARFPLCDPE